MKKQTNFAKGAAAGFLSGLVASFVMNQFQAAVSALMQRDQKSHGAQSQQEGTPDHGAGAYLEKRGADEPDDNAAERTANVIALGLVDKPLSEREKEIGGTIFHYAFGATSGAFYGAASEVIPQIRTGNGLPFGMAVWLLADEAVVPALGLSKSASEYSLETHAYALSSHLVYGLTTELAQKLIRPMVDRVM